MTTDPKPQPFDPRLREAMAEIKAIVKKYDIGAVVVLSSRSHVEFLNELTPTWSIARWGNAPGELHFNSKDIKDPEEKKARVTDTCHMIMMTRDVLANHLANYVNLADGLQKALPGIEHRSAVGEEPDAVVFPEIPEEQVN